MKCVSCGKENKKFKNNAKKFSVIPYYFCDNCKNKSLIDFKYCYVCGSELMPDADHKSDLWCPQCILKITTIIK